MDWWVFFVLMSVFTLRSKFKWNIRKKSYIYEERINCEFCGWRTSCVCTRNTKDKSTYRWALALSPHTHTHTTIYPNILCPRSCYATLSESFKLYTKLYIRQVDTVHTHTHTHTIASYRIGKVFSFGAQMFSHPSYHVRACLLFSTCEQYANNTVCVCVSLMIV